MEILNVNEMIELYGFNRNELYILLNRKGCPVLPRSRNAPYRVIKEEFERWLRSCCNR